MEIIEFIGVFGLLGFSFQISLISDIIDFCTLHIYYIYLLVSKIFLLGIDIILSLGRLILGR